MNRLIVALLCVLIVLVAGHGVLVWRASRLAHDAAEEQTCLQRTQTTAIVALVAPALIVKAEEEELKEKVRAIRRLSAQSDAC